MTTRYRLFEHTADLGIEIFGAEPAELFVHASQALFDLLVSPRDRTDGPLQHRMIDIEGQDWPDLMFNWLRELLYLFNGEQQIVREIRMASISENRLRAEVSTRDVIPTRDRFHLEIKAVTYHQLEVGPRGDRWRAKVIFDI